jgi:tetratricopeptide (TPR) repeat protein
MLQAHFGLALSYSNMGLLDEEISAYKKVLSINPQTFAALANLGRAYIYKEDYPNAIQYISAALTIEPTDADLLYQLGTAYLNNNQSSEGVKALHKAIEMNPRMGVSHYNLAVCYYNLKLFDLAWDHMNEAKRLGIEVTQEQLDTIDRQRHTP